MSGIYGVFCEEKNNDFVASSLLKIKRWNLAFGDGQYHEKQIMSSGLGICRDHITNAPLDVNPVICEKGFSAVIDAIIYNRDEIISKYSFSNDYSDEYLIFKCVTEHGFDSLAEINGDFCGAVINSDTEELTLFRDHLGIRPLFLYKTNDFIAFSSEMRGLIALPEVSAEINPEFLYRNTCGYDTADMVATEVSGIFEMRPSAFMTVKRENDGLKYSEKEYWKLGSKKIRLSSDKAYGDRLRELITDSVKRRLDVFPGKVGAELSGGLDSGVIDILISRLGREGIFYSWSYSPKDLPLVPNDERQVIADICDQENIYCNYGKTTIDMGPKSNIGSGHTRIGLEIDMNRAPRYNLALPLYINTDIISETAQLIKENGGSVVFTGHGGDEGVSHRCGPFELYYHHEYIKFFKQVWKMNDNPKLRFLRTLWKCRYSVKMGRKALREPFNTGRGAQEILKTSFVKKYEKQKMPSLAFHYDTVEYVYSGNTHNRPDVAAFLGAYSGARYIFPYLDFRVIDYAMSIPRYLYLDGKQNRAIFRKAFKDIMPESLYTCTAKNNPSEMGMEEKEYDWFENIKPFKQFIQKALDREFWKDYLDFDFIDKWVDEPRPSDEAKQQNQNIRSKLVDCYQYQNMVQKIKKLEEEKPDYIKA